MKRNRYCADIETLESTCMVGENVKIVLLLLKPVWSQGRYHFAYLQFWYSGVCGGRWGEQKQVDR